MKKVTGDAAEEHYRRIDPITGEVFDLKPEFTNMSRRPGIARNWFDKFKKDLYPMDAVVMRSGVKMRIPRYYDTIYQHEEPFEMDFIKEQRLTNALKYRENNTSERLKVREFIQLKRLEKLPRLLES